MKHEIQGWIYEVISDLSGTLSYSIHYGMGFHDSSYSESELKLDPMVSLARLQEEAAKASNQPVP